MLRYVWYLYNYSWNVRFGTSKLTFTVLLQVFTQTHLSHFASARGTEAVPGWRRKRPGHARWRRRNEIWHQYQLSPGGVWNNGQQWCILEFVEMTVDFIHAVKVCVFFWRLCWILWCFFFVFITITVDAVVRNVYYKYFHPKEALVSNGVLNRFVLTTCII